MLCNIDLRFTIPPLLNFFLLALNSSKETFLFAIDSANGNELDRQYFFLMVVWLFVVMFILFFLLTSVKMPLNVSLEIFPLCLRFRDFSGPLALSLLASLLLPLPLFCAAYFICICISPWFPVLVNILRQFCHLFIQLVQATPTFLMAAISQRSQETIEPDTSPSYLLGEADTAHALEIVSA